MARVVRQSKITILEYTNVNDAPEFVKDTDGEIKAIVVETADAIGVDAAQDSDNLSGTDCV